MKLTHIANKIFAVSVVALVVAPLTSSFGFYDSLSDEIYATSATDSVASDTAAAEDTAADDTASDTSDDSENYTYKFNNTVDVDYYDYSVSFDFGTNSDGTTKTYTGIFRNNLKSGDVKNSDTNLSIKLDDLGTVENPYVILEIAPNVAKTEIRAYVKDSSVYGKTNAYYDDMKLTDEEEAKVRKMTREYLFYKITNSSYASLAYWWSSNDVMYKPGTKEYWECFKGFYDIYKYNAGWDDPQKMTNELYQKNYDAMMKFIEDGINDYYDGWFDKEYKKRLSIALEEKKEKLQSDIVRAEEVAAGFGSAWHYKLDYVVGDDGYFKTYTEAKTDVTSTLGTGDKTNVLAGEYQFLTGDYNNNIYVNSNVFIKGCMTLGYSSETYEADNGDVLIKPDSMDAYIDEYIFCGWYYYVGNKVDDDNLRWVTKDTTAEELNGITDLYTSWAGRKYESTVTEQIVSNGTITIDYGDYVIHLPNSIASAQSRSNHHDNPKNQLSFVVIDSYKGLTNWGSETVVNLKNEVSAWDMTFKKSEIKDGKDLLKIAPLLMADTDYYVETYNEFVDTESGVINYYPYNVQVVTVTPEELNKMVYYDYATNGWSTDEYHEVGSGDDECSYINKFLNDIDLVYITNGNNTLFLSNTYEPCEARFPTLYAYDGTTKTYVGGLDTSAKMQTKANDIEWQAAYKIYTRALDPSQGRRVSMVMDRTTYSATANIDGGKAVLNLDKIYMFYFEASDPTLIYNMYVVDSEEWQPYQLQKVKGDIRGENDDCPTYFTGVLYDQTKWNVQLFYPYEVLSELGYYLDHKEVAENNLKLGTDFPWGNDINAFYEWYEAFGLAYNLQPTTVVNYYARTFIGGNQLGQGFASKEVTEEFSVVNNSNSNNTTLMFDYFGGPEGVRPSAIVEGKLSTENAIEFMVQMVRENKTTLNDREITIENPFKPDVTVKNDKGKSFKVPRVLADMSTPESWVIYDFYTSNSGYYVPEYYWTPTFQNIDNINALAGTAFLNYTKSTDPDIQWIKLDTTQASKFYTGVNMYNTFSVIYGDDGATSPGDICDFNVSGIVHNIQTKTDRVPYQFLAEYQPTIDGKLKKGQYVIVMQCYASQSAYLSGAEPLTSKVTMHNVILDKASYLFNLD